MGSITDWMRKSTMVSWHITKASIFALILPATLSIGVSGCSSAKKSATAAPAPASAPAATANDSHESKPWPVKMQSLSHTLSDLLPLVASRSKFSNEKNFARIEADTQSLRSLAHGLKAGAKPNNDPSMQIMSGLFEEDISRALDSLRSGNREYARQILNDTTSYCIQCHTQTSNGPDFPKLDLSINMNELSPVEQAEFYSATRQFDRSLEAYQKALSDEKLVKADSFEWEQSARAALSITVRVKDDPKEAAKMIAKFEKHSSLPTATKQAIASWKQSVQEWMKEKKPKSPFTPAQVLAKADELIKSAQKKQEFPLDHSQDISYFRAASLLHSFLQGRGDKDEMGARALYLAGIASEATRDMNFWTLHETFYEQCIRIVPHTKQAQQCFDRLKDSITLGYSGSGGIHIPPEDSRRLESFRTMAQAEEGKAPAKK